MKCSMIKPALIVSLSYGLAACNTTILPEGHNRFSSVTTSSSQTSAEYNAKKDIEDHCKKMNKNLVVSSHNTTYHGTTTENKIIGAVVGGLVGMPNPAVSSDDYEVKMRFYCR
jgi:hypothetical protein